MKKVLSLAIIFTLANPKAHAQAYGANSASYQTLLRMSANAHVLESLPRSCKYVTTDVYTASSGGSLYMRADAISIINRYDEMDIGSSKQMLDKSNQDQVNTFSEMKRSLAHMINMAKQKLQILKSAKSTFALASTQAMNDYNTQKSYLQACVSDLSSAQSRASSIPFCGSCASAVGDTKQKILQQEGQDYISSPSVNKENVSQSIDSDLFSIAQKGCSNILCLPALAGAVGNCNTYRNRFWINQIYCNPGQISMSYQENNKLQKFQEIFLASAYAENIQWSDGLGLSQFNPEMKQKIIEMRQQTALFTDNWIAGPRGRANVWGAMEQMTDESIRVTEEILARLQANEKQVDELLRKLGKDASQILAGIDFDKLELNVDARKNCSLPECKSFAEIAKIRADDYGRLGAGAVKMAESLGKVEDEFKKGKLSKVALAELAKIEMAGKHVAGWRSSIEAKLDRNLMSRNQPAFNFNKNANLLAAQQKDATSKLFGGVEEMAKALMATDLKGTNNLNSNNASNQGQQLNTDATQARNLASTSEASEQSGSGDQLVATGETAYKIPYNFHSSDSDLWKIIHQTYQKVFSKRPMLDE